MWAYDIDSDQYARRLDDLAAEHHDGGRSRSA